VNFVGRGMREGKKSWFSSNPLHLLNFKTILIMQAATNTCERFSGEIRKPSTDKREYRYITLSNKLKCLLVSDPETEKSAACVDVQVGSLSDPPNAQGLAHFLEHMLFMGTETYPEENAYSAYLSNHGGFSNAYTAEENTVYYFDVQNDFFEGALDLFASFFTCPLFTESSTMREINAVDSEHNKNVQVMILKNSILK